MGPRPGWFPRGIAPLRRPVWDAKNHTRASGARQWIAPTFHDQVGYWLWNPIEETVTQTIAIPRGQVALASGRVTADATTFTLRAERGDTVYGICSNPFLEHAFTTVSFEITVTVNAGGTWGYDEDTVLQVLERDEPFHHTDRHILHKVDDPTPNPLAR